MERTYRRKKLFKSRVIKLQRLKASSQLWKYLGALLVGGGFCIALGCTSFSGLKPVSLSQPVELQLQGDVGRVEQVEYRSYSRTVLFEDQQKVKQKEELVDFTVQQKTVNVDLKTKTRTHEMTVLHKDGLVDLHDLAFPEVDEVLKVVLTDQGDILKAGRYPKNSVFFVPPVPFPKKTVRVGDTWSVQERWLGAKNGVPLQLNVTTVFKGLYQCPLSLCAHLELSGDVKVLGALRKSLSLQSRVHGYLLLSTQTGAVVWSEVHSRESIQTQLSRVVVDSCLSAYLKAPKNEAINFKKKGCQPDAKNVLPASTL